MYIIIYRFTPKADQEAKFIESWKKVTDGIYQYRGSLGSRLHKDTAGNWIAYAQWPSKEAFEKKVEVPFDHTESLKSLMATLEKSEVLYELSVVEDLLKS